MDAVFKALGDPHRRTLLDALFAEDGQTLTQLEHHLDMTRFGVMKHLKVLEEAGLVTTEKVGREKHHYLNPIPIQLLADRWIDKFAAPWAGALGALKKNLESPMPTTAPTHVYEIYIRTTPERLWQALIDPADTIRYFHGTEVRSTWEKGDAFAYVMDDGNNALQGEILEIDPPHRLVTSFEMVHRPGTASDAASRVTWEITEMGEVCRLRLIHDQFDGETATYHTVSLGWAPILNSLKSLLETGEPMPMPEFPEDR